MKNITFIFYFFLGLTATFSQNLIDTVVWKAETRSGGIFIGVSESKYDAENVIDELSFEKEGTKYQIVGSNIKLSKIRIDKKYATVFDAFKSDHPELEYKYISEMELISLEYITDDNLDMAVRFYKNASRKKNSNLIKDQLSELYKNYSKYLFDLDEPSTLVSYSE